MKRGAYLSHLRQYAEYFSRSRKSYGVQVDALYFSFVDAVNNSDLDPTQKADQIDWAGKAAQNEYGRADSSWQLPVTAQP